MATLDVHGYKAAAASEIIEIVDENNVPLAPTTRKEMRERGLIHRATYCFMRTSNNYFYVQKRSMLKDYCPGHYDPTPGGVVAFGESYEETNRREVAEEMGVADVTHFHLFTFYYQDDRAKCFGDAWECIYDGPLKPQKEEVDEIVMMPMCDIISKYESGEMAFTKDSIFACYRYVNMFGSPEPRGEIPTVDIVV